MTIEIRELVIRAVVDARPEAASGAARAPAGAAPLAAPGLTADERDELVARCVREALRAVRKTRAR